MYEKYVNPTWHAALSSIDFLRDFRRAEGCFVYDDAGRGYLDCVAGFGAVCVGHNNEVLIKSMNAFLASQSVSMNPWGFSRHSGQLAEKLISVAGHNLSKVHFAVTGAEAVESAVKFAMVSTGRSKVIAVKNGFHGLTVWSTQAAGNPLWRELLPRLEVPIDFVEINDVGRIEELVKRCDVAAVLLEPVQGSSGGQQWTAEHLLGLQEVARRSGTAIIVDEVFTGLARTGRWFAFHAAGEKFCPDLVVLSKSLSGGLVPISCVLMTDQIFDKMFGAMHRAKIHGSTFSGNGLSISCALATLNLLMELDVPRLVSSTGTYLRDNLENVRSEYPAIGTINSSGLACAFQVGDGSRDTEDLAGALCVELLAEGVLTSLASHEKSYIRLTPPLTCGAAEVDILVARMRIALGNLFE